MGLSPFGPRAGERGFTLVEMLVALLLMALVGLTLVRFQTFQLAGAGQLALAAAAELEADNRAIAFAVQPEAPGPSDGSSSNAGITWYWRVATAPPPDPATMPDLVRLDISVALEPGGPPLATRSLLRPQRLPPEADS